MLLHDRTKAHIDNFAANPSHALIVRGDAGSGKLFLAFEITVKLLALESVQKLNNYPYFKHLRPMKRTVSIDQVRELQNFFQLKTAGDSKIRRIAVIENAHFLSVEAQNALLKILEEPPQDSVLILTVQGERSLKETIYSRSQQIVVQTPELDDVLAYYGNSELEKDRIIKAYFLAGGGMGLISALLRSDETHVLLENVKLAKKMLSLPIYERLCEADSLSKQPETLPDFLYALRRVILVLVEQFALTNNKTKLQKITKSLSLVHETEASLEHNPNVKLLLTNLLIKL
jgi:DNA polymerase-3 subunit delta'